MTVAPMNEVGLANETARAGRSAKIAERYANGRDIDRGAIRKVAEEFESVFIGQMLGHMFSGIKTDDMFGGGPGEDIYRDLLIDEYGKQMSRSGGIGLADSIERQLLQLQEIK